MNYFDFLYDPLFQVLKVLRQDVGEGWWEGCNSAGQVGLFPAAYVEVSLDLLCQRVYYFCHKLLFLIIN